MSDAQIRESQEKFLLNTALRTITRSFGAALLHYQSQPSEPMETAIQAKINLKGKINPSNMNLEYPAQDQPQVKAAFKQMTEWSNFFNGVARGLSTILGNLNGNFLDEEAMLEYHFHLYGRKKNKQLTIDGDVFDRMNAELDTAEREYHLHRAHTEDEGPRVVDWEWVFCKIREDKECSPTMAGFILAAGLSGQSMSVNPYDLHEFLSLYDKLVIIALLLGTSVAYRGTANVYMNKMLYAHLPFLLQPTLCDFRIEPTVQTVSLLSLGYLFAEHMHTQLTNDLINQMAKETFFETDPGSERYAYVLSAGFATGLINLCKGDDLARLELPVAVSHLRIHERLFILLNGGRRDLAIVNYHKDHCAVAQKGCCSCGMSRADQRFQPQHHQHHHRQRADRLHGGTAAGTNGTAGSSGNSSTNMAAASSHVAELQQVNIHLSSPGACAALALIYMRTNNKSVADKLKVPEKLYQLGFIRPDVIMLRTLARSLILYDSIGQTSQWVESQISSTLRDYFKLNKKPISGSEDLGMLARGYLYSKAGACLAMALKYPSTWDQKVTKTLNEAFDQLINETSFVHGFMLGMAGKNAKETCINVLMSALAIVNAGSGDISLVRSFRKVRNLDTSFMAPPKESHLYSTHVISNMCLGLLFLGHGRYGLSMSNMSIASLLIAFYPVYGHAIYDNRCYFQAFRFLWTLAVEPRFFVTVADGSHLPVEANLEIGYKDENVESLKVKTPYLLPPLEIISSIRIRAAGFKSVLLDLLKVEDARFLREVVSKMSGRFPLKKCTKPSGTFEFSNLSLIPLTMDDSDLDETSSEHSFQGVEDSLIS